MDFSFDCEKVLSCKNQEDKIATLSSSSVSKMNQTFITGNLNSNQKGICEILDRMGEASSKVIFLLNSYKCYYQAQGLGTIITTAQKFFGSDN